MGCWLLTNGFPGYCGNELNTGSVKAENQGDCNFACGGNDLQYCGAGSRLQLYNSATGESVTTASTSSAASTATPAPTDGSTDPGAPTPPSSDSTSSDSASPTATTASPTATSSAGDPEYTGPPVVNPGNANFTYYSCVQEPSAGRVLDKLVENGVTNMTIAHCLEICAAYKYAGVEYASECWCGDAIDFVGNEGATPGGNVSDSECSFTCKGNSSEFCGAGLRLSLYYFDVEKALADE